MALDPARLAVMRQDLLEDLEELENLQQQLHQQLHHQLLHSQVAVAEGQELDQLDQEQMEVETVHQEMVEVMHQARLQIQAVAVVAQPVDTHLW